MIVNTESARAFFAHELREAHARLAPQFDDVRDIRKEHLEYVVDNVLLRFVSAEAFKALHTRTPLFDWVSAMQAVQRPAQEQVEEFGAYCMFQVGVFPLAGLDEHICKPGILRTSAVKKGVPMKHYVESGKAAYYMLSKGGSTYLYGTIWRLFREIAVIISSITLKRTAPEHVHELLEYWEVTQNPFAQDRLLEHKVVLPLTNKKSPSDV